jgi:hypothetical protein
MLLIARGSSKLLCDMFYWKSEVFPLVGHLRPWYAYEGTVPNHRTVALLEDSKAFVQKSKKKKYAAPQDRSHLNHPASSYVTKCELPHSTFTRVS